MVGPVRLGIGRTSAAGLSFEATVRTRTYWLVVTTLIVILALATHIGIIANPGLLNHDEIQMWEYINQHGVVETIRHFSNLHTTTFEIPVRPVGRAIWALTLLPYPDYVFLVHAMDVLTHAVNTLLVFILARRFTLTKWTGAFAAALFLVSPLTAFATGWSAAIFDRLFVAFGLVAILMCVDLARAVDPPLLRLRLFAIGIASLLSVLSKESAIFLPIAAGVILLALLPRPGGRVAFLRNGATGLLVMFAAVVVYLVIRREAIAGSLAMGASVPSYQLGSESTILLNVFSYFGFPFAVTVTELPNMIFFSAADWLLVTGLHVSFIALIVVGLGWRAAALYLSIYFVFLLPVIPLQVRQSHYLYWSAIPMAIALALAIETGPRRRVRILGALLFAGILVGHHASTQVTLYSWGRCQARLFASLETLVVDLPTAMLARPLFIVALPGSPSWVLVRSTLHTTVVGGRQLQLVPVGSGDAPSAPAPRYSFDRDCLVRRATP